MHQLTHLILVSIQVRDLPASAAFYREILAFEPLAESPSDSVVFARQHGAAFVIRQAVIALGEASLPGLGVAIWFEMQGLEAFLAKKAGKLSVVRPIHQTPFGKVLVIADPDGYAITLNEKDASHGALNGGS